MLILAIVCVVGWLICLYPSYMVMIGSQRDIIHGFPVIMGLLMGIGIFVINTLFWLAVYFGTYFVKTMLEL